MSAWKPSPGDWVVVGRHRSLARVVRALTRVPSAAVWVVPAGYPDDEAIWMHPRDLSPASPLQAQAAQAAHLASQGL